MYVFAFLERRAGSNSALEGPTSYESTGVPIPSRLSRRSIGIRREGSATTASAHTWNVMFVLTSKHTLYTRLCSCNRVGVLVRMNV